MSLVPVYGHPPSKCNRSEDVFGQVESLLRAFLAAAVLSQMGGWKQVPVGSTVFEAFSVVLTELL